MGKRKIRFTPDARNEAAFLKKMEKRLKIAFENLKKTLALSESLWYNRPVVINGRSAAGRKCR